MTRTGMAMVLLLGVSSSGCLLESHVPSDPLPFSLFCAEFFDALCEPLEDCGCAAAAVDACLEEKRVLCSSYPNLALVAAEEDGRIVYDGSAAAALVARVRERSESCQDYVSALDWRVRDLFDLGGVFVGTTPAGEACESVGFELISVCALGSCSPTASGPICRASVPVGESCDRAHQCVDLDARLEIDSGVDRLALRCVGDPPESEVGICMDWIRVGGACIEDRECWTSHCRDSRCIALEIDETCLSSRECASEYCRRYDLTCQSGDAPFGAECDDLAACASHVCVGGVCVAPACATF